MMKPSPEQTQEMLKRLARVEGQVRGVHKLVEADADCEKILQQMAAARKALDKAYYEMIACLIETSVNSAQGEELPARMAEMRALLSKYA